MKQASCLRCLADRQYGCGRRRSKPPANLRTTHSMTCETDELLPTRWSLLSRLKNWDDQESWQEFFSTYWKLIYSVAIKAGLTDEEAEDVVQETVLSVAKKMDTFKYDPEVCSFRGWLMHVTRLRITDQLRKRRPGVSTKPPRNSETSRTATIERVPDPVCVLDSIWDE